MALQGNTKIFRRDAVKLGPAGNLGKFDIAFLDPPYGKGLGEKAIEALHEGGWLAADAIIVLEEKRDALPGQIAGFSRVDHREFGDTAIAIFRQGD
jgi:16S rRNA (guanine966-N2)-methyltransferase